MEPAFRADYDAMAGLVSRVMAAMAVGLGLDARWFEPFIDRHTSALRALHYPDLADHASSRDSCGPAPTPTTAR